MVRKGLKIESVLIPKHKSLLNAEGVNTIFGIVALLACVIQQLVFSNQFTSTEEYLITAVVLTIFLNTTHIGFSYSAMIYLPEARQWIQARFKIESLFFVGVVLLIALFTLLIADQLDYFSVTPTIDDKSGLLALKAITFVSVWHNMAQSMGLSLRINYNLRSESSLSERELKLLNKVDTIERWGTKISFALTMGLILDLPDFLAGHLNWSAELVMGFLISGNFLCVGFMLFYFRKMPGNNGAKKVLFALRYLIWPLLGASRSASWAFQAVHGLEYWMVNRQMAARSRLAGPERSRYKMLFFAFALMFFIFGIFEIDSIGSYLVKSYSFDPKPFIIVSSISTGMFLVHLIWDRYFFRFRDPIGRATAGRLLLGSEQG